MVEPRYATRAEGIARAKAMKQWQPDVDRIFAQREWAPRWLAQLVVETPFQFIAFEEVKP